MKPTLHLLWVPAHMVLSFLALTALGIGEIGILAILAEALL